MRFSKQNNVIRLKSNILAPQKFLGWLRHWLQERRNFYFKWVFAKLFRALHPVLAEQGFDKSFKCFSEFVKARKWTTFHVTWFASFDAYRICKNLPRFIKASVCVQKGFIVGNQYCVTF